MTHHNNQLRRTGRSSISLIELSSEVRVSIPKWQVSWLKIIICPRLLGLSGSFPIRPGPNGFVRADSLSQ